ncbi:MAG: class I mannose-6-phosphate isomerase [Leptospiraceae bacterium]|nr:class I mannose-6-phosphate isomerase [Leptospiraceae bacterium]
MKSDILKLAPCRVGKPWGGGHLGVAQETGENIGELVLISDLPQFPVLTESGQTFRDYWRINGNTDQFPFMIKILSTREPLSLQVHPADEDIEQLKLTGRGKAEAWVILHAAEDAITYLGMKDYKDRSKILQSSGNLLSLCNSVKLKKDDIVILSPGLIHGTQGELLFFEIQQPSDHTFRIDDFGRGRELHLQNAYTVTRNLKPKITTTETSLSSPFFQVDFYNLSPNQKIESNSDLMVLTMIEGSLNLQIDNRDFLLQPFNTFLLLGQHKINCTDGVGKLFCARPGISN